jgi:hypothetical protein
MTSSIRVLTSALGAAALAGCATAPPRSYEISNSRTFIAGQEQMFQRALDTTARNQLYVKISDRRNGVLNVERSIVAPSRTGGVYDWADCGSLSLLEQPVSQLVELNVVVEPVGQGGGSKVTLNTHFSELRQDVRRVAYRVNCTSTGQLEHELLQQLAH